MKYKIIDLIVGIVSGYIIVWHTLTYGWESTLAIAFFTFNGFFGGYRVGYKEGISDTLGRVRERLKFHLKGKKEIER